MLATITYSDVKFNPYNYFNYSIFTLDGRKKK